MSGQTRLDIAFDVCQLDINFKYSDDKDIKYTNKIIAHLKQEPLQIVYQTLGNECNLKLLIFAECISWQFKWWEKPIRLFNYASMRWWKLILEKRLTIGKAMLREMFEQKSITNTYNNSTRTQLANALAKKGASTKELLDLLQKGIINIWNHLYMFSFRWNRFYDINWTIVY